MVETNDGGPGQDKVETKQEVAPEVAATARGILHTVVTSGTGRAAYTGDPSEWGKTGTTENNGDAWFVGATKDVTVAVWVGHANSVTPMTTEYGGAPVDGGTIPALIFNEVINAVEQLTADEKPGQQSPSTSGADAPAPTTPAPAPPSPQPAQPSPSQGQQPPGQPSQGQQGQAPSQAPPSTGGGGGAAAAAPAAAPAAAGWPARAARRSAQRPRQVLAAGRAEAPGKLGAAA